MNHPLDRLGDLMVWIGAALAAMAPMVLMIELAEWIAFGQWPGWSVEDGLLFVGLDEPLAHFDFVQFLLDIATDLPLAMGLYVSGILTFLAGFKMLPEPNGHTAKERRRAG